MTTAGLIHRSIERAAIGLLFSVITPRKSSYQETTKHPPSGESTR